MKATGYFLSVLFISCFAARAAYSQEVTMPTTMPLQEILKAAYLYFPDAQAPAQQSSDSFPGPVSSSAVSNKDSVNVYDTIALTTTETDSIDIKEPAANTITRNEDGTYSIPGMAPDKKIDKLISKYADMMSVEPEDVKNFPLYKFINQWYGVKYKWGGTDNSGIDCSGFSQKLYFCIYSVNIKRTARQQRKSSELVKDYDDANEGDLVFFRIHHIRISHVGIYLANGYFVHASRSHGVVISSLNDKYWRSRYAGCGRIARQDRPATESDFVE